MRQQHEGVSQRQLNGRFDWGSSYEAA